MTILSIQSHVTYGHVGNSAAVFLLQSLGHRVWPVHTVHFSNHPGYAHMRGTVVAADALSDLIRGLALNGWIGDCQAVLAGYMGSSANGRVTLDAVKDIKKQNPDAMVLCDPVIGDHPQGVYVADDLVAFYRAELCPAADVITPNLFELQSLTGLDVGSTAAICDAARSLIADGPSLVLVTSVMAPGDAGRIGVLAVTADQAWQVFAPVLCHGAKGAGDTFAALWLGHRLHGASLEQALVKAVSGTHHLLDQTARLATSELPLVTGIDGAIHPRVLFEITRAG